MKQFIKQLFNHSTEIIIGIFILLVIMEMGKLLIQRIKVSLYDEVFYVYACPQGTKNSKCYKVRADYVPGKWINEGNDYEPDYFEAIYFDDGGYISFNSCDIRDKTYTCFPKDNKNATWSLQISEVKKIKK